MTTTFASSSHRLNNLKQLQIRNWTCSTENWSGKIWRSFFVAFLSASSFLPTSFSANLESFFYVQVCAKYGETTAESLFKSPLHFAFDLAIHLELMLLMFLALQAFLIRNHKSCEMKSNQCCFQIKRSSCSVNHKKYSASSKAFQRPYFMPSWIENRFHLRTIIIIYSKAIFRLFAEKKLIEFCSPSYCFSCGCFEYKYVCGKHFNAVKLTFPASDKKHEGL